MALERAGESLGAFYAQLDAFVLDGRNGRLGDARDSASWFWLNSCSSRRIRTDSPDDTSTRVGARRNSASLFLCVVMWIDVHNLDQTALQI